MANLPETTPTRKCGTCRHGEFNNSAHGKCRSSTFPDVRDQEWPKSFQRWIPQVDQFVMRTVDWNDHGPCRVWEAKT